MIKLERYLTVISEVGMTFFSLLRQHIMDNTKQKKKEAGFFL